MAWGSRAGTGLCALQSDDGVWRLVAHAVMPDGNDAVLEWIAAQAGPHCVVAIDAPLFIPNRTGTRACDRCVASRYAAHKIGVYPCNQRLFERLPRSRLIRRRLETEFGFSEATTDIEGTLTYFETYPHPAIVNLLELDERIAYKKGRVRQRRERLSLLARLLRERLPRLDPPVAPDAELDTLLVRDWQGLRGRGLKAAEDEIDALVCAYAAARWIAAGLRASEVYGRPGEGMMIFPGGG